MHGEDMPMMGDMLPNGEERPVIGDMLPKRGELAMVDVGDMFEQEGVFGSVLTSENVLWRLKESQRGLVGTPRGPSSPPTSFSTASVLM